MNQAAACANIGPREQRKRLVSGIVALLIGAAVAAGFMWVDASRWWRAILFGPFFFGALGVFQARSRTCVFLALRGVRNLDDGPKPLDDPVEIEALRRQAEKVYLKSLGAAALLTGLGLLLPAL
jgi:hypothetical protein